MKVDDRSRCPTCRARFSAVTTCARCGADLSKLMLLLASAARLRAEARSALLAGDASSARARAEQAQALAATPAGARLAAVARCLLA